MAGMTPGPNAKPDDVRQRRNTRPAQEVLDKDSLPSYVNMNPAPPDFDPTWHPVARAMYDALLEDPARMTMTSADWAIWMLTIENVSLDMMPQVVATIPGTVEDGIAIPGDVIRERVAMNGTRMANVLKLCAMTGITQGARLSMNINLKLGVVIPDPAAANGGVVKNRADLMLVPDSDDDEQA